MHDEQDIFSKIISIKLLPDKLHAVRADGLRQASKIYNLYLLSLYSQLIFLVKSDFA